MVTSVPTISRQLAMKVMNVFDSADTFNVWRSLQILNLSLVYLKTIYKIFFAPRYPSAVCGWPSIQFCLTDSWTLLISEFFELSTSTTNWFQNPTQSLQSPLKVAIVYFCNFTSCGLDMSCSTRFSSNMFSSSTFFLNQSSSRLFVSCFLIPLTLVSRYFLIHEQGFNRP